MKQHIHLLLSVLLFLSPQATLQAAGRKPNILTVVLPGGAQNDAKAMLLLDNGTAKVGINRAMGGAITWLSAKGYPKNMVRLAKRRVAIECRLVSDDPRHERDNTEA